MRQDPDKMAERIIWIAASFEKLELFGPAQCTRVREDGSMYTELGLVVGIEGVDVDALTEHLDMLKVAAGWARTLIETSKAAPTGD